jgi:hypothetical protein
VLKSFKGGFTIAVTKNIQKVNTEPKVTKEQQTTNHYHLHCKQTKNTTNIDAAINSSGNTNDADSMHPFKVFKKKEYKDNYEGRLELCVKHFHLLSSQDSSIRENSSFVASVPVNLIE